MGDAPESKGFSLTRAARALQDNVARSGPVASASYSLIGAILLLGGAGYALDGWLGTRPWCAVAGLMLGVVVGFYELVKTAWPR